MAQRVRRWLSDQEIVSSSPARIDVQNTSLLNTNVGQLMLPDAGLSWFTQPWLPGLVCSPGPPEKVCLSQQRLARSAIICILILICHFLHMLGKYHFPCYDTYCMFINVATEIIFVWLSRKGIGCSVLWVWSATGSSSLYSTCWPHQRLTHSYKVLIKNLLALSRYEQCSQT